MQDIYEVTEENANEYRSLVAQNPQKMHNVSVRAAMGGAWTFGWIRFIASQQGALPIDIGAASPLFFPGDPANSFGDPIITHIGISLDALRGATTERDPLDGV